jgi:hypothetical protein
MRVKKRCFYKKKSKPKKKKKIVYVSESETDEEADGVEESQFKRINKILNNNQRQQRAMYLYEW